MSRKLQKLTHKYEFLKFELEEVEETLEGYMIEWNKYFGKYFRRQNDEIWVNEETGEETITETTKVTFNSLSDEAIRYYIDTYQPFDKAGSYGIQEWIGLVGITKIEGSYTNVVGLPVEKVYKKLIHYAENY